MCPRCKEACRKPTNEGRDAKRWIRCSKMAHLSKSFSFDGSRFSWLQLNIIKYVGWKKEYNAFQYKTQEINFGRTFWLIALIKILDNHLPVLLILESIITMIDIGDSRSNYWILCFKSVRIYSLVFFAV